MADNEEDYIDVSELKEAEPVKPKKESFGSRLSSSFKSVGQKASGLAKKRYASYKESRTPEAMERKLEAEKKKLKFEKRKYALRQEKQKLYAKKAEMRKKQFQSTGFGGLAIGAKEFIATETKSMSRGKSPGKFTGEMGNPFSGGMPRLGKGKKRKQKQQTMYNPFG